MPRTRQARQAKKNEAAPVVSSPDTSADESSIASESVKHQASAASPPPLSSSEAVESDSAAFMPISADTINDNSPYFHIAMLSLFDKSITEIKRQLDLAPCEEALSVEFKNTQMNAFASLHHRLETLPTGDKGAPEHNWQAFVNGCHQALAMTHQEIKEATINLVGPEKSKHPLWEINRTTHAYLERFGTIIDNLAALFTHPCYQPHINEPHLRYTEKTADHRADFLKQFTHLCVSYRTEKWVQLTIPQIAPGEVYKKKIESLDAIFNAWDAQVNGTQQVLEIAFALMAKADSSDPALPTMMSELTTRKQQLEETRQRVLLALVRQLKNEILAADIGSDDIQRGSQWSASGLFAVAKQAATKAARAMSSGIGGRLREPLHEFVDRFERHFSQRLNIRATASPASMTP